MASLRCPLRRGRQPRSFAPRATRPCWCSHTRRLPRGGASDGSGCCRRPGAAQERRDLGTEAGFSPAEVEYATAEAVVVAHCESGFDPNAVVFDGQFVTTPHPATGDRYTAAGVFQFIRPIGDEWIEGGYANVHDPTKNIDAAARLYVANLQQGYPPWSDWACAAVNDGYAVRSVLPGWPGGPSALPDWAFEF